MQNRAFWRAIHSLAHPISLIAILALLLNDHFLRIQSPSWLTGKLGDFAWLVFAPFICAAVVAWLIRGRQQEKIVGIGAFIFIGVWFALAKTMPLVHGWTTDALEIVVGYRGTLRIDPTDLITLPALLIGWQVWRQAQNTPQTLKPRAWVLLALGAVGTVANSQIPVNYGITTLCQENDVISAFADTNYLGEHYASEDGGLTWQRAERDSLPNCTFEAFSWTNGYTNSARQVSDGTRFYRYTSDQRIESSIDRGETWTLEQDLSAIGSEARRIYYQEVWHKAFRPGPLGVLVDSQTHNIIIAMGHDGVLVRTPDGTWRWVGMGNYYYREYNAIDGLTSILNVEWGAALVFMIIAPITIARPLGWGRISLLIATSLIWGLGAIGGNVHSDFGDFFGGILTFILAVTGCIGCYLSVEAMVDAYLITKRGIWLIFLLSIGTGLLFLFPYILWIAGTIPLYSNASLYSLAIGLCSLLASRLHLRRQYPELFKVKRKLAQQLAAGEIVFDDEPDNSDD
jgi:hypothetical protein